MCKTGHEIGTGDMSGAHDVANIEVGMREAAPLVRQDAVVGVLGGILRHSDAESAALLHALEDKVDAESVLLLPCGAARGTRGSLCGRLSRPIPSRPCGYGRKPPPSRGNRRCAGGELPCSPPECQALAVRSTRPVQAGTIR